MKNGGKIIYNGPIGERSSKVIEYFEAGFLNIFPHMYLSFLDYSFSLVFLKVR